MARFRPAGVLPAVYAGQTVKDLGWILLAWAIFNTYMLLISAQTTSAVFAVFLTLEITEVVLFIGFFTGSSGTIKLGGYIGIVTAPRRLVHLGGRGGQRTGRRARTTGRPGADPLIRSGSLT